MSELCLICGTSGGGYDNMCEACFRSRVTPSELPRVLKMKICSSCSFMVNTSSNQRLVEWEKGIAELVSESLSLTKDATLLGMDIQRRDRDDYLIHLEVNAVIDLKGLEFRQDHASELRITYGVCNRCSRQSGNYYEAIIQVRGGKRTLTDDELEYSKALVERRIRESSAENAFITSMGTVHKGLDYSIGDRSVARDIAKELQHHFGAHFQESYSLAGRKDGKDIYRSTYLIRLLDFRPGDFVMFLDKVHLLTRVSEKSASVTDLSTGISQNLGKKDLDRLKLAHGDVVEAVVVSAEGGEAQVLDPVSFKTETVLIPHQLLSGESYRFFRCEDGLFHLPESLYQP